MANANTSSQTSNGTKGRFAFAAAALTLALSACAAPAEEEGADTGPEAATINTANSDVVGDASEVPGMVTVQLALDEACPTMGTQLRSATCEAEELGQTFSCDFAFQQDPEGVTRELTLTQSDGGWMVEQEPKFCETLSRADAMADDPSTASVPTQPE